ncbi:hypothetical protein ASD13_06105 [Microbacterium sp. Root1433D1]|nr:hypothetical protein ASD13_06105 [Microbacterium sp. Root1433D1]
MRVTKTFGLSGVVPFVDVHVHRDNLLFLDPSAIRNGGGKYAVAANKALIAFFTEVLRLRLSSVAADHVAGQEMLEHLHEPNETRLGMSVKSKYGRAFGHEESQDLWKLLENSREARIAVLTRLEQLRLFADGVGYDLISDATTRIVFHVLADFTTDMMSRYPSLAAGASTDEYDVFDPATLRWTKQRLTLPVADGRALLLVPKEWVYWRLLMDVSPFYNRYATETLQAEQTVIQADGKASKPSKKKLKENNRDKRELNRKQAVKYKEQDDRNLVDEYQREVDAGFTPLTDDEIRSRTSN